MNSRLYKPRTKVQKPPRKLLASFIGGPWNNTRGKLDANLNQTETFYIGGFKGFYSKKEPASDLKTQPLTGKTHTVVGYKWFWHAV